MTVAIKTKFSHAGLSGPRMHASFLNGDKRRVNAQYDHAMNSDNNHASAARALADKVGLGDRRIVCAEDKGTGKLHIVLDEIDPAYQWTIEVLVYYPANSAAQFKARAMRKGHDVLVIEGSGSGDYGAHAICQRLADAGLIPKYDGYYNSLVIRETVQAKCTTTEVERKRDFCF